MAWPSVLETAGVTPSVVAFFAISIVVLIYLFFFQQTITAKFYKLLLKCFLPQGISVKFERFSFSMFTGQISIHRVQVVTQDMQINAGRICATLFYWRKIPTYKDQQGESNKCRLHMKINALDVLIFNRSWTTDMVLKINDLFELGKSTEEVTEFLKKQWPDPQPYSLSLVYRAILPFMFDIKSASFTVGNERLPAFCKLKVHKIEGKYSFKSRETPESHLKSKLEMNFEDVAFQVHPHQIPTPPIFATSMRDIFARSKEIQNVLKCQTLDLTVLSDMVGCYVNQSDSAELGRVNEDPQAIYDITIGGEDTEIEYGPYTDKLRRAFMTFFTPFYFNNPMFREDNKQKAKYMKIFLTFKDKAKVSLPFVTNLLTHEKLIVSVSNGSKLIIDSPQNPTCIQENVMSVKGILSHPTICTSLGDEPIIKAELLDLDFSQIYPEVWYETTTMNVSVRFIKGIVQIHPYHIDFLTQLGTDWASWYPYQTVPDTAHNFFPYNYNVSIAFDPGTISLLLDPEPEFSQFHDFQKYTHVDLEFEKIFFKISAPFLEYQAVNKSVSFSAKFSNGIMEFVLPENHQFKQRKFDNANNYLSIDSLVLSGSYRWTSEPGGDVSFPLSVKIGNVDGIVTFGFINDILCVLQNYTTRERKVPDSLKAAKEAYKPDIVPYKMHTSVNIFVVYGLLKIPYDLYDTSNFVIGKVSDLLIAVDGVFPFWSTLLNIKSSVVEIPPTNYQYESWYKDNIGIQEMNDASGIIHVDGININLRSLSSSPGTTISSDIAIDIGKISGFALLPQVISALELTNNIIYEWFSEDTEATPKFEKWYFYMIRTYRVLLADITLCVDMGHLGLLPILLPSGLAVYMDNLIDEDHHSTMHVVIPAIDVAHLIQESSEDPFYPTMRITTFLNIERSTKFDGTKEDAVKQAEYLRLYDKAMKQFGYLWGDVLSFPETFYQNIEIFDPSAYQSSLKEEFEYIQEMATDPDNYNSYTLSVPAFNYATKKKFASPQKVEQWLHHYNVLRHYMHNFSSIQSRASFSDTDPVTPTKEEIERLSRAYKAMNFAIPNQLIVNIKPLSIPVLAALFLMMNDKPDSQLLSSIVRTSTSDYLEPLTVKESSMAFIAPMIQANIVCDVYTLTATLSNLKFIDYTIYKPLSSQTTLLIDEVRLSYHLNDQIDEAVITKIPNIKLVSACNQTILKINPIDIKLYEDAPQLIGDLACSLKDELTNIPSFQGKSVEDFKEFIQSSWQYAEEKKRLKSNIYVIPNAYVPQEYVAEITAFYTASYKINISDFTTNFRNVGKKENTDAPEKRTTIFLSPISVEFYHSSGNTSLLIAPNPVTISSSYNGTGITAGIKSLSFETGPSILLFLDALKQQYPEEEEEDEEELSNDDQPEKLASTNKIFLHFIANQIHVKFSQLIVDLNHLSCAISTNPSQNTIKKLSITATIQGLVAKLASYLSVELKGVSLCQRRDSLEGALKISPINVSFPIEFALNPMELVKNALEMDLMDEIAKNTKKTRAHGEEEEDDNRSTQAKGNNGLVNAISDVSFTVLIEPITVESAINKYTSLSLQFPGVSGLISNGKKALKFFTFIHQPIVSLTNIFQFQFAHLLLVGSVDLCRKKVEPFLMLGDVSIVGESMKLAMIMGILNEILEKSSSRLSEKGSKKKDIETGVEIEKIKEKKEKIKEKKEKIKKKIEEKEKEEGYIIEFEFLMPQISIELPEIQTRVDFKEAHFALLLSSSVKLEAEIVPITLSSFESSLTTEIYTSYINNTLEFTIMEPNIVLNQTLFLNVPKLKHFAKIITSGMKKQKHVKKLIKEINQTVQTTIEKGAENILKQMGFNEKNTEYEFPTKISSECLILIKGAAITLQLPRSGECLVNIPDVSFILQTRNSDKHDKTATAAIFSIEKVSVQLDSAESSTTGTSSDAFDANIRGAAQEEQKNLSNIQLDMIELSAILFNHKIFIDSEISNFMIRLFPTFPLAFASILEEFKPDGAAMSTTVSESEGEYQEEEDIKEIVQQVEEEEEEGEISKLELEANFKCIKTDIKLSPIENTLPIPDITLTALVKNNHACAILDIKQNVTATLSPLLIDWVSKLNKNLKILETTTAPTAPVNPSTLKPKVGPKTQRKRENSIIPESLQKSFTLATTPEKKLQLVQKVEKEAKFTFDAIVNTKEFKIELNCAPRRSDVKIICKFAGLNVVHTSSTSVTNARLIGFNICTEGPSNLATPYAKQARLFDLKIPGIDATLLPKQVVVSISNISFDVSSDKIEDVVLFNDIWVVPFIRVFSSQEDDPTMTPKDKAGKGKQRIVPSPRPPLPLPLPAKKPEEAKDETQKEGETSIKLLLGSFEIKFMYGTGAGSLILTMYPIRFELAPKTLLFTIGTTTLKSTGQLVGTISLENVYALKTKDEEDQSALIFMVSNILADLKKADDPFLLITISRVNLSSKSSMKKSIPYTSIMLSIDKPVLKATGNLMQNVLTFYRVVTDPIFSGLKRANRSYTMSASYSNPSLNEPMMKKAEDAAEKVVANGKLAFILSNTTVELHKYFFTDNEAVKLAINGAFMSLSVSQVEKVKVNRGLKFDIMPIILSKLIESSKSTSRDILKIPQFKGELNTVQDKVESGKADVLYDFVTDFKGLIEPTLNLQDYSYLQKFFEFLMKKTGGLEHTEAASDDSVAPQKKIQYNFQPNNYQFNPGFKVGIGAELKPNISWLLSQLGIADEHIIPASLFEGISLGLEKIIAGVSPKDK